MKKNTTLSFITLLILVLSGYLLYDFFISKKLPETILVNDKCRITRVQVDQAPKMATLAIPENLLPYVNNDIKMLTLDTYTKGFTYLVVLNEKHFGLNHAPEDVKRDKSGKPTKAWLDTYQKNLKTAKESLLSQAQISPERVTAWLNNFPQISLFLNPAELERLVLIKGINISPDKCLELL